MTEDLLWPDYATPDDLAAIEAAVPADAVSGDRYEPAQMAALDSERRA
jgi:hypothetical protein